MYYARKNSLCDDGDRPFYHNPARLKMGLPILYFHFHTRSKYLKWSNQTVPVHPPHIYKKFTPIVTYPMQSGPDAQPFLGKQSFVYALLHCRSKGPANVFSVIWPIIRKTKTKIPFPNVLTSISQNYWKHLSAHARPFSLNIFLKSQNLAL